MYKNIYIYIFCFDILNFFFFLYVQKFVIGLAVRDNDQIYEVLGWPLFDPTACGTHRASQETQTSRVACVGFNSKSEDCAKVSAYRPDYLFQEQLGV